MGAGSVLGLWAQHSWNTGLWSERRWSDDWFDNNCLGIIPTARPPAACASYEATCANGECIDRGAICDGDIDCSDGSDESSCSEYLNFIIKSKIWAWDMRLQYQLLLFCFIWCLDLTKFLLPSTTKQQLGNKWQKNIPYFLNLSLQASSLYLSFRG